MFSAFIVVLREIAEILLVLEALRAYAVNLGRPQLAALLPWGVAAGCGASAAIVAGFNTTDVDPRLASVLTLVFAASVLALALGMLSSHRKLWAATHATLDRWILRAGKAAPWLLAGLAAFATVREATEIALFLRSLAQRRELQDVVIGGALGALAAALLTCAYLSARARVNLQLLFGFSSLLLCLLAIQLMLGGVAELLRAWGLEAGTQPARPWLPGGGAYPWVCSLLMLPPVWIVLRRWWRGSSRSPARRNGG